MRCTQCPQCCKPTPHANADSFVQTRLANAKLIHHNAPRTIFARLPPCNSFEGYFPTELSNNDMETQNMDHVKPLFSLLQESGLGLLHHKLDQSKQ